MSRIIQTIQILIRRAEAPTRKHSIQRIVDHLQQLNVVDHALPQSNQPQTDLRCRHGHASSGASLAALSSMTHVAGDAPNICVHSQTISGSGAKQSDRRGFRVRCMPFCCSQSCRLQCYREKEGVPPPAKGGTPRQQQGMDARGREQPRRARSTGAMLQTAATLTAMVVAAKFVGHVAYVAGSEPA